MVRFCFAIFALGFATASFTYDDPIISFTEGTYLGQGYYHSTGGDEGVYSSYAEFTYDTAHFALVIDGNLRTFDLSFYFYGDGFFEVAATEAASDGTILDHEGYGHCASVQCHYTIEAGDRVVEETITFATWEDRIYKLGSIRYTDEDGETQQTGWEEYLVLLDGGDDDDDEDEIIPLPVP